MLQNQKKLVFMEKRRNIWVVTRGQNSKFTREERVADKAVRSPFFENLEEIGKAKLKSLSKLLWSYQCGIAVYQLTKLRMLEFFYNFLDKCFSRQDFELRCMDTDLFYLEISGDSLDEIVRPEMRQA